MKTVSVGLFLVVSTVGFAVERPVLKHDPAIQTSPAAKLLGQVFSDPKAGNKDAQEGISFVFSPANAEIHGTQSFRFSEGEGKPAAKSGAYTYARTKNNRGEIEELLVLLSDEGKFVVLNERKVRLFAQTANGFMAVTDENAYYLDGKEGLKSYPLDSFDLYRDGGSFHAEYTETASGLKIQIAAQSPFRGPQRQASLSATVDGKPVKMGLKVLHPPKPPSASAAPAEPRERAKASSTLNAHR